MPWENAVYSRDEIYAAVWAEPKQQLAKKIGISDVGLGKVCRKLRIPVPSRGYWARLASGQRPIKPTLPKLRKGDLTEYKVFRWRQGADSEREVAARKAISVLDDAERILVPEVLHHIHPLLQKHLDSFGQMEGKFADFLKRHTCVALWVSPESLDRALRIMTTLFEALEARGGRIEVTKHEPNRYGLFHAKPSRTGVWFGDHFVPFSLSERSKTILVLPPPPEPASKRPSRWDPPASTKPPEPIKVSKPSGVLTLHLEGRTWGHSSNWTDGKRLALQDRLHEIVKTIQEDAELMRLDVIEARERELKAVEERNRREEKARVQKEEEARLFDLWSRVEDFTSVLGAKTYLQSVEAWGRATGKDLQPDSDLGRWLTWARESIEFQERDAIETVLTERREPKEEALRQSCGQGVSRQPAWGYWARTYKGW